MGTMWCIGEGRQIQRQSKIYTYTYYINENIIFQVTSHHITQQLLLFSSVFLLTSQQQQFCPSYACMLTALLLATTVYGTFVIPTIKYCSASMCFHHHNEKCTYSIRHVCTTSQLPATMHEFKGIYPCMMHYLAKCRCMLLDGLAGWLHSSKIVEFIHACIAT